MSPDIDETELSGLAKPKVYLSIIAALKRAGLLQDADAPRLIELAMQEHPEGYHNLDAWLAINRFDDYEPPNALVWDEEKDEFVTREEFNERYGED